MEGTVTGEHGVGLVKRDYLTHELGETTVDAMRRVCVPSLLHFIVGVYLPIFHSSNSHSILYVC